MENENIVDTTESKPSGPSTTSSYWDSPPEEELAGKTLSTLNLSQLEQERMVGGEDDKEKVPPPLSSSAFSSSATSPSSSEPPSTRRGSYWEWQETMKKSISKLTLTELFYQKQETTSTEAVEKEDDSVRPSEDKGNSDQGGNGGRLSDATGESQQQQQPKYWFWKNASFQNLRLSTANLDSLESASREADGTTKNDDVPPSSSQPNQGTGGGYWFWRNASFRNLSTASLDTLEAKSDSSSTTHANGTSTSPDPNTTSSSSSPTVRPISQLSHKLRTSWRKSFQQMSNNSLAKLDEDESVEKISSSWKQSFSINRKFSDAGLFLPEEERGGGGKSQDIDDSQQSSSGAIEF